MMQSKLGDNYIKVAEGKSKIIFKSNNSNSDEYLYFKYKGDVRCSIQATQYSEEIAKNRLSTSLNFFSLLKKEVKNVVNFKKIDDILVKMEKVTPIKLEWIPRFFAAGSVVKRFGFPLGYKFNKPVLKIDYKTDSEDYLINDDLIIEKKILNKDQLQRAKKLALQIGFFLYDFCQSKNIDLWDFKLELGIDGNDNIVLIDEISFDGMRLKDKSTGQAFDKDVFRKTGNVEEVINAYNKGYFQLFGDNYSS